MHHSKELSFTFIMMPIFCRCFVLFNNYSTLIIYRQLRTTGLFSCYRIIIFESEYFLSLASLKPQNKTALHFYFLSLKMSIQMLNGQVVSIQYLKNSEQFSRRLVSYLILLQANFQASICAAETGLSRTLSETLKTGFLASRPIRYEAFKTLNG